MNQSIMENLFRDHPFFQDEDLLWPGRCGFAQSFLNLKAGLLNRLNADRPINELFQNLDDIFSSSSSSSSSSSCRGFSLFLSRGLSPEDVVVSVSGRKLDIKVLKATEPDSSITGAADWTTAGLVRSVELPDHMDPSTLTCTLGADGFLTVQSQQKETSSEERLVPIRFRTSLDFNLSKEQEEEKKKKKL